MNATDTETYRAFAGRVRQQLATARKGAPTVNTTTTTETVEAPTVPATFLAPAAAGEPCERNPWCVITGAHANCYGPEIGLPTEDGTAPGVLVGQLHYDAEDGATVLLYQRSNDWIRFTSGEMRAEANRVRAHLARLDALADQYDAITEAAGQPPAPAAGSDGHFPWCAPGACRTHHTGDATWTEHEGAPNGLPNRARIPDHTEPLLESSLYHCADFGDNPQIGVDFRGEGTTFTAAEADLLIADFEEFLTQLKAQRARMGEKPAVQG